MLQVILKQLTSERATWFGAGLSAAAVGVVAYQLLVASLLAAPLPGQQPTDASGPTADSSLTRAPRPTATPYPIDTPRPTRTPTATPTERPTRTPTETPTERPTRRPTSSPPPTRTPLPTSTPTVAAAIPDVLATLTLGEPDMVVGVVATFAARTSDALEGLQVTPRPR
jgi:hypothetical protein